MAKLSDDLLKFVIDLDASGAQGQINTLTSEIAKLEKENKSLQKTISANEKELKSLEKQMSKLERAGKTNTSEFERLQKAYTSTRNNSQQLRTELNANTQKINQNKQAAQQLTSSLKINQMTMNQLRERARQLQQQLDATSKAANPEQYKKLQRELQATQARMSDLNKKSKSVSGTMKVFAGNLMASAVATALNALKNAMSSMFGTYAEFENKSSALAATLGKTRSEISALTTQARNLGATTTSTANQILDLQQSLANLGFSDYEIQISTAEIETFATALGISTAEAAQIAGNALRDFKLPATEMNRVVSTLGVSTTKSALNFEYLKTSLDSVAPTASAFGFTIEDTVALLGTLANSGMRAGEAASATRMLITKLADANSDLAKKIGKPVKNMDDMVAALKKLHLSGMNFSDILEISDRRSVTALETWIKQTDQLSELKEGITDVSDALAQMADIRVDNGLQSVNKLKLAWEDFSQAFMRSDVVVWLKDSFADILDGWTNMLGGSVSSIQTPKKNITESDDYFGGTGSLAYKDMADYAKLKLQETFEKIRNLSDAEVAKNIFWSADSYLLTLENMVNEKYEEVKKAEGEAAAAFYSNIRSEIHHARVSAVEEWGDEYRKVQAREKQAAADAEAARVVQETKAAEERKKKAREAAKARAEQEKKNAEEAAKAREENIKEQLKDEDNYTTLELNKLKERYANREITEQEFNEQTIRIQLEHLERLKALQEEFGIDTIDTESKILDLRLQLNKAADKQVEDLRKKAYDQIKEKGKEAEDALKQAADIAKGIAANMSDTLGGSLMTSFASSITAINKMMEIFKDENKGRAQEIGAAFAAIATTASQALNSASQITSKVFEMQTESLEAEKQKQLSIAGESAEAREQIELEYAQKELDLKKKQADANAGVQSAQLWINTAMGVASAWASSMQLGPIAGPIAAAALTATLLATAGVEQALILKQRDAIKNQTLDHSSAGTTAVSAPSTGSLATSSAVNNYTLKKEYGYADGGYTGDGEVLEPAGIVHKGEYVVPQQEMANPTVVPMVRRIESIRAARLRGYAAGGYVSENNRSASNAPAGSANNAPINLQATLARLNNILEELQQTPLTAVVNYREFRNAEKTMNKIQKKASK